MSNLSEPDINILLNLEKNKFYRFYPLLQQGFIVKTLVECSMRTMLCDGFGIDSKYVDDRITTIFLDGSPVDDVDSAVVKTGSTLALSAAMPGLVGATFRKGGKLASFRSTITYQKQEVKDSRQEGTITLKLFNLLLGELGPVFLRQGIRIKGDVLADILKSHSDEFQTGCKTAKLNGKEISIDKLAETNLSDTQMVQLSVLKTDEIC